MELAIVSQMRGVQFPMKLECRVLDEFHFAYSHGNFQRLSWKTKGEDQHENCSKKEATLKL